MTGERWAIVGGGFLGMTLALRLAQQGKAVTLYEAASSLGGLASAWQLGNVVWDRHYHVTLFTDVFVRALLQELGLEQEMRWEKARTGFYVEGCWYSMSTVMEFLRFPPLNLLDKIRLGATVLHASRTKDWQSLEKIPVEEWLKKWSGRNVLERIWLPLLRAKLGENYRDTSAAFIWATMARMYSARRTRTKTDLFGYVPGGYARIIGRFADVLRREAVECRLGEPVRAVKCRGLGSLRIELANGDFEFFEKVVVTTAPPLAERVCPQLTPVEKQRLRSIKYQGIICASLLLENPLSNFYITNITDGRMPYTAVIEMSSLVDRNQFDRRALVYLPKYVSSDSPAFNLSDDEIREQFLSALEQMYPRFRRKELLCFQISRVKYLLPVPVLNYSANLPDVTTSLPGLYLWNSAHIVNGTLNVNETLQLAEIGARKFGEKAPLVSGIRV